MHACTHARARMCAFKKHKNIKHEVLNEAQAVSCCALFALWSVLMRWWPCYYITNF